MRPNSKTAADSQASRQGIVSVLMPHSRKILAVSLIFSVCGLFFPRAFQYERNVVLKIGRINSEPFESLHVLLMKTDPRSVCGSPFGLNNAQDSRCVVSFGPAEGLFSINIKANSEEAIGSRIEKVRNFYDSEYEEAFRKYSDRVVAALRDIESRTRPAGHQRKGDFFSQMSEWELAKKEFDISASLTDPARTFPNSMVYDSGSLSRSALIPRAFAVFFFFGFGAFFAVSVILLRYLSAKYDVES